ncbi:uncharacterized protein [Miscanthus floridulus]|uniref:uncharacterized protein n=1 Tax=Miscanthus floridulus TaxID=154761 RepID=UPI0034597CED
MPPLLARCRILTSVTGEGKITASAPASLSLPTRGPTHSSAPFRSSFLPPALLADAATQCRHTPRRAQCRPPPRNLGVLFLAAWAASRALVARLGFALSWKLVLATQVFCWTWQFLGHGLFEKKGPTVSDLPEVFLMEPFLIFLQILNKLFGYEPYPEFCKNVDRKMEADLRESRELKQRKTT